MIHILHTSIQEAYHPMLMNECLSKFSWEFQKKILRYRRWQDAQLSLLGRLLLKEGMSQTEIEFDDIDLKFSEYNKPFFKHEIIRFNISHATEIVACALTQKETVGIDIEKIQPIKIDDFKTQMATNEWQLLMNSKNQVASFFNYWTQKEAVLKAHGKGLSIPLKSFEIKDNKTIIESEEFYLQEISLVDQYSCHIACKEEFNESDIKITKINPSSFIT